MLFSKGFCVDATSTQGIPFMTVVRLFAAVSVLGCATAHAELNLWISYYAGGVDAHADARFEDAAVLMAEAQDETAKPHQRALALDVLGKVHTALGRYEEAEAALHEALCLKESSVGPRSRTVPATLNALGDLHYIAGSPEKAEQHYRRALDIHATDPNNVEVCRSLNGMALLHAQRGEFVQAEELLTRAIRLHFKGDRSTHPYRATAMINLATLLTRLDRADEAGQWLHDAAYIQTKQLRGDHPDVAVRLHAEANHLLAEGDSAGAYRVQQRALSIRPDSL